MEMTSQRSSTRLFFGPIVIHGHLLKEVEVKVEEKKQLLPTGWQQKLLKLETVDAFVQCAKDFLTDIRTERQVHM